MNSLLSILDTNSLTDETSVSEFVHKKSASELLSLTEGLREAMLQDSKSASAEGGQASLDKANFLPSSSLRGASGCEQWECRSQKIRTLARYVALYCDKGIVPINLDWRHETNEGQPSFAERFHLVASILTILELRPLIEAGLVVIVPEVIWLCERHWGEAVPGYKKILKTAETLSNLKANKFNLSYEPVVAGSFRAACLKITGPEKYLDHGKILWLLGSFPSWVPPGRRLRRWKVSPSTIRNRKLLLPFFMAMANDALLQGYFGAVHDARYVTDLAGELEFYQLLNKRDILAERTASLCARLTHTVPLMSEIPIEKVMKVRREDPEAFQNYRSTLTGIVKNHVHAGHVVSDREAKEIYIDLLKPQLDALQAKAVTMNRAQIRKGALKVAATTAIMGLGIYTGLLPSEIAPLVKAVGGLNVARDIVETIASIKDEPAEVRNHNLYFLMRLRQISK
jgi:hypothetical protein